MNWYRPQDIVGAMVTIGKTVLFCVRALWRFIRTHQPFYAQEIPMVLAIIFTLATAGYVILHSQLPPPP